MTTAKDLGHGFYVGEEWYSRTHYAWKSDGHFKRWENILAEKTDEEVVEFWAIKRERAEGHHRRKAARGNWRLAVYHWEEQQWPEFRKFRMTRKEAEGKLKKLARHFKTPETKVSWQVKKGDAGHYSGHSFTVALGSEPSLGVVCHEFAHHLNHVLHPTVKVGHDKEFKKCLKKVYTFAKRWL